MRRFAPLIFVLLSGCTVAEFKEDSVKPSVTVESDAVHPEVKTEIQKGGVTGIEKGAMTLSVDRVIEVVVPKDAVHVEPINVHTSIDNPALNAPFTFTVLPGAVQMSGEPEMVKVTLTVAKGAITVEKGAIQVHPKFDFTVAPNAVTITGAEVQKGAISIPWWMYAVAAMLGTGWLVTKVRGQSATRDITRPRSFLDLFF